MVSIYSEYKVILVSNSLSNVDKLPFEINKHFKIGKNAWVDDYSLIDVIKKYIDDNNISDHLFLFCAGPFGNLLSHQLFSHNKNNIYIDIGSTLNHLLVDKQRIWRGYLKGGDDSKKICVWEN